MNFLLQGLGGQPVFGITDEIVVEALIMSRTEVLTELLRRGQNLNSAGGVVQLGVRSGGTQIRQAKIHLIIVMAGANGESSR